MTDDTIRTGVRLTGIGLAITGIVLFGAVGIPVTTRYGPSGVSTSISWAHVIGYSAVLLAGGAVLKFEKGIAAFVAAMVHPYRNPNELPREDPPLYRITTPAGVSSQRARSYEHARQSRGASAPEQESSRRQAALRDGYFCHICGTDQGAAHRFCGLCGARLEVSRSRA
jgi:hypothetical protein